MLRARGKGCCSGLGLEWIPRNDRGSDLRSVSRLDTASGATTQPMSPNLRPGSAQGGWGPLTSSSFIVAHRWEDQGSLPPPFPQGDTCQGLQPSSASPGDSPAGHVLGRSDFTSGKTPIPEFPREVFPLWSLLTRRTQSAAAAAGGPGRAASLLTCSTACLPGLSQMLWEGLPLQNPPFSLLPCPPQQRFLGWFRGRSTESDVF